MVLAIPMLEGDGYIKDTITIEYEWQPPRCETCKTFGHSDEDCPKMVRVNQHGRKEDSSDGFVE